MASIYDVAQIFIKAQLVHTKQFTQHPLLRPLFLEQNAGACCNKCYEIFRSQESYEFGECYEFK